MKVADVMERGVISITPESSVTKAARMMLLYEISGLPVIDSSGRLVGIVTEGDFLRRAEIGTERHRKRWVELLVDIGPLAEEYAHSHGRKVEEVMTRDVVTVTEDASLEEVARLMERHRIKRVPVLRDAQVIGIVSRANFLPRSYCSFTEAGLRACKRCARYASKSSPSWRSKPGCQASC